LSRAAVTDRFIVVLKPVHFSKNIWMQHFSACSCLCSFSHW